MLSYCFYNYFNYRFQWLFCSHGLEWGFTNAGPLTKVSTAAVLSNLPVPEGNG